VSIHILLFLNLSIGRASYDKKGSGQPAMNRSKQAGMGKKAIVVLLVGLTLASSRRYQT
jgi:hypothetical protein